MSILFLFSYIFTFVCENDSTNWGCSKDGIFAEKGKTEMLKKSVKQQSKVFVFECAVRLPFEFEQIYFLKPATGYKHILLAYYI